jgi:LAS superfamily LD-carboxypeptidase LdcB
MRYAGLLVVIAGTAAALCYSLLPSSSSTGASQDNPAGKPIVSSHRAPGPPPELRDRALGEKPGVRAAPTQARRGPPIDVPRGEQLSALGEADGAVPDGTTVFDDEIPGVVNLDPALLRALRQAATDAAHDGVEFFVNSGWRSPEYQGQLLHEAVSTYGSEEEAARWVATPTVSAHVSGDAVDIGPFDATAWLSEHGAEYGLCQIYGNEAWHYELRPRAIDRGCPPMYADPTHDPRTQQRMSSASTPIRGDRPRLPALQPAPPERRAEER